MAPFLGGRYRKISGAHSLASLDKSTSPSEWTSLKRKVWYFLYTTPEEQPTRSMLVLSPSYHVAQAHTHVHADRQTINLHRIKHAPFTCIPSTHRLRQESQKFVASLAYVVKPYCNKQTETARHGGISLYSKFMHEVKTKGLLQVWGHPGIPRKDEAVCDYTGRRVLNQRISCSKATAARGDKSGNYLPIRGRGLTFRQK